MLGQQFATILARTDPFDVAQALERYIRTLNGAEVRMLIQAAAPRMNDWYRSEFLPLLNEIDNDRLRSAFAHSLKSNLRAIPMFGPNFCEGVIARIPGDRTVALGEESRAPRLRLAAFAIIGAALLLGGAAAEHVLNTARANANTPVVLVTPQPAVTQPPATPAAVMAARTATPVRPTATVPAKRVASAAVALPQAPRTSPPVVQSAPVAAPQPAARPVKAAARRTPPPGAGVKTVIAQEPTRTPAPQATPVDTSDMPQSYSDATPLPADATPPPTSVNTTVRVPTPTPAPNRNWLHSTVKGALKTLNNFNPFKHHGKPEPTNSPYGPEQP